MTVIAMSRTEIDRMSVLQDLATSRIKIAEAATLMGLGRRQGIPTSQGLCPARPGSVGFPEARPPEQSRLPCGFRDSAL